MTVAGVRCPRDVVLRRQLERQDRTLGQAEARFAVVHRWADRYDVEVDMSVSASDESVTRIAGAISFTLRPRIAMHPQRTGSSRPAALAAFDFSAQAASTLSLCGRMGQCSSRLPISSQ